MSEEEKKTQQPEKVPAGARAARGGAGVRKPRGAPAGARTTRGGAAGARATRGGAAAHPSGTDTSAEGADASKTAQNRAQLILKKFNPVYISKSSVVDDYCGMCRNTLDTVCNNCYAAHITDTNQCPTIQGKCQHRFHLHCIQGWLKKSTFCPAAGCGARWEAA